MNRTEYLAAISKLGMNQAQAARFLGVHPVTSSRWTTIPTSSARLLRLAIDLQSLSCNVIKEQ